MEGRLGGGGGGVFECDEETLKADGKALEGDVDALKGEGVPLKSRGKALKDDRVAIKFVEEALKYFLAVSLCQTYMEIYMVDTKIINLLLFCRKLCQLIVQPCTNGGHLEF